MSTRRTKPTWKKQLADAHQRNRDLDNANHELNVQVGRLSKEVADLKAEIVAASDAMLFAAPVVEDPPVSEFVPLCDSELMGLNALVLTQGQRSTPARRRLVRELVRRGIMEDGVS